MSANPEDRLNAALEGRYTIERELGEGGMATVYLADDLKHERKVAIKVLRPELAAVVGAERFLAEIKTTANLQHPSILPLFDSGDADGFLFYVMPYVEGESLRERLARDHQLAVDEAVRIARQVASALAYAHEKGVVHRDIKPANILLSGDQPVVADFGIALAVTAAGGGRLTETGLSLGTPHYMSPEQATGQDHVGPPTDVYALGCVLYEMLVGEPPHTGATAQAVLGKILLGEVSRPTRFRRSIPPHVEAVILRALESLPADRFDSLADFSRALDDPGFRHGGPPAGTSGDAPWRWVALASSALLVVSVAVGVRAWLRDEPEPVIRYRLELPPDSGLHFGTGSYGPSIAVSPDGSRFVYVGPGDGSTPQALWVKEMDELKPRRLPGTEGAFQPFFSPDGERIGFVASIEDQPDRILKVVPADGGLPVEVQGPNPRSGFWWGADGFIYKRGGADGIVRIPETGGPPEPISHVSENEVAHQWPELLPNGRGVLFTVMSTNSYDYSDAQIAAVDLETGERRTLMPGIFAHYAASGHLVVVGTDGTLLAAPFDQDELTVGPPVPIAEGLLVQAISGGIFGAADMTLSMDGTLVYVDGVSGRDRVVVWVDRDGNESPIDPVWEPAPIRTLALSPDDRRLAVSIGDPRGQYIWVKELPDGPLTRLSMTDSVGNRRPVWSADGSTITFMSGRMYEDVAVRVRSDGSDVGEAEVVLDLLDRGRPVEELVYTPDGSGALVRVGYAWRGEADIGVLDLATDSVHDLLATDSNETSVALSPDGRWIAYVSDVTGQNEVFVRPFPSVDAGRTQVSVNGGTSPVWSKTDNELFYITLHDDWLTSAAYAADSAFVVEGRERLLDTSAYVGGSDWRTFDVTSDGARFVFIRPLLDRADGISLVVVHNLFKELRERVGSGG